MTLFEKVTFYAFFIAKIAIFLGGMPMGLALSVPKHTDSHPLYFGKHICLALGKRIFFLPSYAYIPPRTI